VINIGIFASYATYIALALPYQTKLLNMLYIADEAILMLCSYLISGFSLEEPELENRRKTGIAIIVLFFTMILLHLAYFIFELSYPCLSRYLSRKARLARHNRVQALFNDTSQLFSFNSAVQQEPNRIDTRATQIENKGPNLGRTPDSDREGRFKI